ncbi:GntR family transcriptional regulator [Propionicimonas sp.]|uniref:GntR family transcriptional regulator n=1 Tax=Propionicimonas sp. TaxID=1955623 RepID=UPI0017D8DCA8|nr:GntR family transcriptional regulator [Propionicimonas sp.]MBU3975676.1 GntR family transcriptional regulator [Actinomycetota bacterium]MBA3019921.1 GntR family transcriptional regulator [Propionicimonas sp.]MBU3986175.1 GntR family transcriptional regulator [Actinomycetota bacterium]MBU4007744.1 GntR family transcriptional regulator [Actinomycetota bacterium]MBU4064002.1 GntR family transcriptional regulator [Actinomycetota bacterium]
MASRTTLVSKVSEDLRAELASGVHAPGGRLPAESQLAEHFSVSRPTIRAALRELEAMGLVKTQHGVGTFVVDRPSVRAGLERLDSITDSIRAMGSEPGMVYASRVARHVMPDEASIMGVPGETQVLELRRTITADGEVVAYSYDLIPLSVLPKGFDTSALSGSLFRFFREELGIDPHHGLAEVHAAHSEHVGWGPEAQAHRLFVMLNQLHYDIKDQLLMYSRTYFIEGRYNFTIYRSGL